MTVQEGILVIFDFKIAFINYLNIKKSIWEFQRNPNSTT